MSKVLGRPHAALALLVTLLIGAGACAHPPWNPYKNWEVARTKHITAYTNTRIRYTTTIESMELAYAALRASIFQGRNIAPVEVLLLDEPEFKRTLGQFRSHVVVAKLPGKGMLARRGVIVMYGDDIRLGAGAHRMTHLLLHAIAPQAPLWLHEGLATYLETIQYRDNMNRSDEKAFACLGHLRPKSPEIELTELFSWSWRGFDESKKSAWYRYTGSNLVDYFMSGEGGSLRDKFGALVTELAQGGDGDSATVIAKVYPGLTVASLQKKARDHRSKSESTPRGLCPIPFPLTPGELADVSTPRTEPAEQADIEELMLRLKLLPRRQGYVDWYPPDQISIAAGQTNPGNPGVGN